MKTVTGKAVTTKPISHSNAAKYISHFASSDHGASAALNIFLHGATESFNNLVALHKLLKGGERTRSRREGHRIYSSAEAVAALGVNPQGEKAEKGERKGKGKNDGFEVKSEENVMIVQITDGIAGEKRKKGKKSEDFEQKNEGIVKTEGSPDRDVEKKRKKKRREVVEDDVKHEIEDAVGVKNALVDDRKKEDSKGGVEGGKKRKHKEVVGKEVKNLDMADDRSGEKKKKKRKVEGEGK